MPAEIPLYQHMVNDLVHQIESEALPAGSRLPSEAELGNTYGVSRITVRKALAELKGRGYIVKRHGIGSFVASIKSTATADTGLPDVMGAITQMGATPSVALTGFHIIADGRESVVREELHLGDGD